MFPRPLTDEEQHVEAHIRELYGQYLSDFIMLAGTNKGKPIWVIRLEDSREVESYQGPHELEHEIIKLLSRNGINI